jgi:elongation factor Ts
MKISAEAVKEVRTRTNIGILECKDALLKAGGDVERAIGILKNQGAMVAEKKAERTTGKGIVEAYVHHDGRVGALVELNCETDFVARTKEFNELAHNLALQVAATSPQFITAGDIPSGAELEPQAVCLLLQPFIKEPNRTVQEIIAETIAKVGENIKIRRFARFELGV